jgi:hypothetical protein
MIFLKRYRKYSVEHPTRFGGADIYGLPYLYSYSQYTKNDRLKWVFVDSRNHKTRYIIRIMSPTTIHIQIILYKTTPYIIMISDSYDINKGYAREITTEEVIEGILKNTVKLTRTFVCSAELTSVRKAYYDSIKRHFICGIFDKV